MAATLTRAPKNWRKLDLAAKARLRWLLRARTNQLTPDVHVLCSQPKEDCEQALADAKPIKDPLERVKFLQDHGHFDWTIWLLLMGRSTGKTRTGAEDIKKYMLEHPGCRVALVAATFGDGRKIMYEGESGLLAVIPSKLIAHYNRSMGEMMLTNGSQAFLFSAEQPERLRGPQFHRAWLDELASWGRLEETWTNLQFTLRLGDFPRTVITGTPRPIAKIRELHEKSKTPQGGVVLATGKTTDNAENLPPSFLAELLDTYEGTRTGRQELDGEILEDMEGAFWNLSMIEADRLPEWAMPDWTDVLGRTVVGVDPAGSHKQNSDETGIVVVAMTRGNCPFCHRAERPHAVVLFDDSGIYTPNEWALRTDAAFKLWQADRVIAEKNYGGDMVRSTLIASAPHLPISEVNATKSKKLRAEPVFALYERHKVHHWAGEDLSKLEKQMTSWIPDEPGAKSPDRLDALCWAIYELMLPKIGEAPKSLADHRHRGRR